MKIFIDTCAFAAMAVPEDPLNGRAKAAYRDVMLQTFRQYTSDYVLDETYTLLAARRGHRKAVAFMDAFEQSGVDILRIDERVEQNAKTIFKKIDLPRLSFTDCTSFAIINAHHIDHVFTYDEHFGMFRFLNPVTIIG